MKKIGLLLLSILIGVLGTYGQNYHEYLETAKHHLSAGDIDKAVLCYNVYKSMTGQSDEKFELILQNAKMSSQQEYDEVRDFNFGYACVRIGNKWGVVNENFELVVPLKYEKIWDLWGINPKQTTTAAVKNGQMGFVNMQGKEVTEFKYQAIRGIELDTPNIYFMVYQWNGPEVYVDMNGVEYSSEHEAAYGIKGLKHKTETTVAPYHVGDYYNENGNMGVVFEIDDSGNHGKIVSFEQSYCDWVLENNKYHKNHLGLFDEYDGENNMNMVVNIPNWEYIFPAFLWCSKLGKGWYLPSIYELKSINDNVDNIDRGLKESGYRPINRANYISSTEDKTNASQIFYLWGMGDRPGEISNECDKDGGWVVAVRKF